MTFLKKAPISIMILTRLPYLHITFLKNYCSITFELFCLRALTSIYENNLYLLCTTYLQPFDTRLMCTVSTHKTWKSNGVYVTTSSISKAIFCLIWYKWYILIYYIISSSNSGHQKCCNNNFLVANTPLCSTSLWQALNSLNHFSTDCYYQ